MRKFFTLFTLLILASFIANAQTTALDVISDNLNWSTSGNISQAGTGSNRETIRISSSTGYSWGGHNEATSGGAIEATTSGISFSGTTTSASNIQGSYVYTIFSSNGNATPTHHIDLSGYGATFKLYFLNADPDQSFRLMVRDKNGQWFISQTDYTNGSWSTSQGIGTPKVVDEVYTDVHKAYPMNTLLWNSITSTVSTNLNALSSGDNVAITYGTSFVSVDLSEITGAGIYVQEPFNPNTANELVFERFELHKFEPLVIYNPAYSSHYIETSSGVKWGFSNLGGGGSGEFYYPAAHPTQNLNASGWGRAFQSAWRSFYHGGGYNPTQGGRTRNHGVSTPMSYGTSSTGSGTRIDYGPFNVPTMGRPDNDILTYWDLTNGKIPGDFDLTEGSDQDNVNETGLSEKDEVITEYQMTGFYEDITNILTNTSAEAIRIYNQYDYFEDPGMIYQYEQEISTNFANGITDLVAYTTNEAELPNAVRPTRLGIFWGDRLWTDKFTKAWYWDNTNNEWVISGNISSVSPGGDWPSTHERLTILSGPGTEKNAYAVGMYFPEWSEFNQKCIAGVESNTGTIIYEEDRIVPGSMEFRWGRRGSGANIEEQGSGEIIKDFIKRDIGFQVTGMVEPRMINGVRVHERLRFELFHIVGTPEEIKKAVQAIDYFYDPDNHDPVADDGDLFNGAGGTITATGNSTIAVTGNVTNSGTVELKADNQAYTQLKVDGTIVNTGAFSQEQYISNDGYVSLSSPMSSDFAYTSGNNAKLFYYDGSAFAWRTSNEAGRGYFASINSTGFANSNLTFSVTGTPNTSMTHSLSYVLNTASGGADSGWNLVGNPYTCSLDWTTMSKTDVNNAYYVWDPATELYKYYASGAQSGTYLSNSNTLNGIIPPMQAFWVQTTSSSATLSSAMAVDGTLDNSSTYISKTAPDNLIVGVVALNDSSQNDALWLIDNMQAKTGFDGEYDAWKMENGTNQPNISSVFNGEELAINAFDFSSTKVVPVRFNATNKTSHSISLEQVVNGANYDVTLEDRHTKIFWDLSSKNYSFKNTGWDSNDPRFLLHLEQQQLLSTDDDIDEKDEKYFYVYQSEQYIYINQSELGLFEEYALFGIDGRKITNGTIESQLQSIHAPYPSGIYVLLLKSQDIEEKVKINLLK